MRLSFFFRFVLRPHRLEFDDDHDVEDSDEDERDGKAQNEGVCGEGCLSVEKGDIVLVQRPEYVTAETTSRFETRRGSIQKNGNLNRRKKNTMHF